MDLYNNGKIILEKARENKTSITLFGISERTIADFENALYLYGKLFGVKSNYEVVPTKKEMTEKIIMEAELFLEKTIDNLVEEQKEKFPKFYNEYQSARILELQNSIQNHYFFA